MHKRQKKWKLFSGGFRLNATHILTNIIHLLSMSALRILNYELNKKKNRKLYVYNILQKNNIIHNKKKVGYLRNKSEKFLFLANTILERERK